MDAECIACLASFARAELRGWTMYQGEPRHLRGRGVMIARSSGPEISRNA